ncbi:hypothetical protein Ppa06_44000 [Planomonospora parontospora subsp. parontospora]|uniref:Uncharacterized protein n=2 Tax=Planomonospora parontospora TaxID=58119 RepID=A0AA37F6T5_9ACTN|nr:hypothetical protein GCM10010126_49860 [Planomonospora parontospora]GII10602.1 hypothetical protein Ppa06_44000 [Planomonospora parontospora subsp. parontospora]
MILRDDSRAELLAASLRHAERLDRVGELLGAGSEPDGRALDDWVPAVEVEPEADQFPRSGAERTEPRRRHGGANADPEQEKKRDLAEVVPGVGAACDFRAPPAPKKGPRGAPAVIS